MDRIQTLEFRAGGGSPEDSARASGVESVLIVAWRDRLRDLALHLYSGLVCNQQVLSASSPDFGRRQSSRKHTDGRMHEKSVNPVFGHRELSIVEVVDVDGYSIGKGSE